MMTKSSSRLALVGLLLIVLGGAVYYRVSVSPERNYESVKGSTTKAGEGNDFSGIEISGAEFSLSRFSDKPVVVHFWASWCGTCVNEFSKMIQFIQSLNGSVHLVALSADHSDEDIKLFLARVGVKPSPFIHIIRDDGGKVAEQYKAKMLPTSVIIGKGLIVVKRMPGEVDWEDSALHTIFNRLSGH